MEKFIGIYHYRGTVDFPIHLLHKNDLRLNEGTLNNKYIHVSILTTGLMKCLHLI